MTGYRTYSERIYMSPYAYRKLAEEYNLLRWLYNCALEHRIVTYKRTGESVTFYDQCKELKQIRKDHPELSEMAVVVLRGALQRLDRAFRDFFRRLKIGEKPGFPRFKNENSWRSLEINQVNPGMVKGNEIHIKGLAKMRIRPNRVLPDSSMLKKVVIKRTSIGMYIYLTYLVDLEPLPTADHPVVGIDMGVYKRGTVSDGIIIERRRTDEDKLKIWQQQLARKVKGSKAWWKLVAKIARFAYREGIRDRNYLHRKSTEIIRKYAGIVIEDLDILNMTRRGGRRKKGLNREIRKQTWGIFAHQMEYKASQTGRTFVKVNPRGTSQTCSNCLMVDKTARQGETYNCGKCGLLIDADVNAARNIRDKAGGNVVLTTPVIETKNSELYTVSPA